MAGGAGREDTTSVASGGDLDRLVQTEERLQEVLAASEAEAARIGAAARESVDALHRDFELGLAKALQVLEEDLAEERRAEIDRIEREYEVEKVALETISGTHIEELATVVVRRLLARAHGSAEGEVSGRR